MYALQTNYMSSKLYANTNPDKGGFGLFAQQPITTGELLVVWGGEVVTEEFLHQLPERARQHSLQIDDGLYLVPTRPAEPADYVNHSCEPNAGIRGQISLVAMRDILPGEEICFDYAMTDSSPYDEFLCGCGTALCRTRITGNDWRLPELWARYGNHFSTYLHGRIEHLKTEYLSMPAWVTTVPEAADNSHR